MVFREPYYQAEKLDEFCSPWQAKIDQRFLISTVGKEELMTRLTGRRVCKACGATSMSSTSLRKKKAFATYCGGEADTREQMTIWKQ